MSAESIDMDYAFYASRYDKGSGDDYINCPMNKEEYETFSSLGDPGQQIPSVSIRAAAHNLPGAGL